MQGDLEERLARAIRDAWMDSCKISHDHDADWPWRRWLPEARAALRLIAEALREPSEEEGLAGARSLRDSIRNDNQLARALMVRRAMLSVWLREQGVSDAPD